MGSTIRQPTNYTKAMMIKAIKKMARMSKKRDEQENQMPEWQAQAQPSPSQHWKEKTSKKRDDWKNRHKMEELIQPRNFLDMFIHNISPTIIKQYDVEKTRLNITMSKYTESRFRKFVKERHNGWDKGGTYTYELERAMLLYLYLYDV